MSGFIVAYKRSLPENNWLGDKAFVSLEDARAHMDRQARQQTWRMIAVFYQSQWNYGLPTGGPRYLIDRTEKSGWPIAEALAGIVNSRNSDEL